MHFSAAALVSFITLATASPLPPVTMAGLSSLIPKNLPAFVQAQCDLAKAVLPNGVTPPLAAALAGSTLSLVAVGHGTQNYTCADSTTNSIPTAIGAVATLYNASCIAASQPDMLAKITAASQNIAEAQLKVMPSIGKHYFYDAKTPTFDITNVGLTHLKKSGSSSAPANTNGNVAWLFLEKNDDGMTTSKVTDVYRVNTAGGSPPATCDGMASTFEVPYSAEYWFFSTS
ncbi:MAG: hypothetical protein MMC23_000754 [Stictis urceolatum]|nr:hypothetical protein [Stictis urceolata]